ncbi:winged helix-turn-helix domain-containing protein [Streptomyces sp. NBC_01294]|uniref:winged helix-turn-helix domain-containing protein n=1 Tax=Streptomyces sp. NBC_01294 TaxID=2903815 RepID=UPI002DD91AC0|nr:winged helix-turn-helix domain-containing protein [Streptomyces sp. NBC_01294]WRZ59066.1 winged helix-turn-helix domain-containing protein [Streptomyces sp. NBC_01294]
MDSEPKRKPNAREIAARIRGEIAAGTFGPGDRLPGGRAYAKKLGVSLMTVQNAYTQLRDEGLVEGVSGSGTYVRETTPGEQGPREAAQSLADLQAEVTRVSTELAGLIKRVGQLEEVVRSAEGQSGP